MILIELTKDMCGYRARQDWLVAPDLAASLLADGSAINPRDRFGVAVAFPARAAAPAPLPEPAFEKRKYRTK